MGVWQTPAVSNLDLSESNEIIVREYKVEIKEKFELFKRLEYRFDKNKPSIPCWVMPIVVSWLATHGASGDRRM